MSMDTCGCKRQPLAWSFACHVGDQPPAHPPERWSGQACPSHQMLRNIRSCLCWLLERIVTCSFRQVPCVSVKAPALQVLIAVVFNSDEERACSS